MLYSDQLRGVPGPEREPTKRKPGHDLRSSPLTQQCNWGVRRRKRIHIYIYTRLATAVAAFMENDDFGYLHWRAGPA